MPKGSKLTSIAYTTCQHTLNFLYSQCPKDMEYSLKVYSGMYVCMYYVIVARPQLGCMVECTPIKSCNYFVGP